MIDLLLANLNTLLRNHVSQVVKAHLDDPSLDDLRTKVLDEVDDAMFEAVIEHTNYNQTEAAKLLGMNRGTFRKKLKQHGIIL